MERNVPGSVRSDAVYEAPTLVELGTLATLTLAEGLHVGKLSGGADAFALVGGGSLTATSA